MIWMAVHYYEPVKPRCQENNIHINETVTLRVDARFNERYNTLVSLADSC